MDISYPIIVSKIDNEYKIEYPDFNVNPSFISDEKEIIPEAKDIISLCLYDIDESEYPEPTNPEEIVAEGKIIYVNLWLPYHFAQIKNVYKNKTLTIPTWLDELASEKNINFSQTLQRALKEELGINRT